MKQVIRSILPPILLQFIHSIRHEGKAKKDSPEWCTILGGPIAGYRIYASPSQPSFKEMIMGRYDNFFWTFLNGINLTSQTVMDIGGHIGYHSMCFAKLSGEEGKIYVFEPNSANLDRMKMNFKENWKLCKNITVNDIALADFKGATEFYFSANVDDNTSAGGHIGGSHKPLSSEIYEKANYMSSTVNVDTLDNFIAREEINSLKLMKIDVEGAEHKVLAGGVNTINTFRPVILIEIHSVLAMLHVCEILLPLGYLFRVLDEDGASRCFIVALPRQELNNPD